MDPARTILVISDLHVGSGSVDDFEPEIERHFVQFLDQWSRHSGSVELVINGDFLDFVQAPPLTGAALESAKLDVRLCFTERQSRHKLAAIKRRHEDTFRALRLFLRSGPNRWITILPGNHDADFFWPGVRADFIDLVCLGRPESVAQLSFHFEREYRPLGAEAVWIEHGHQYDPLNSFFIGGQPIWSETHPPILKDDRGVERLYECVGTRLLIQFLNTLDAQYPFVDNVKPFKRFVNLFGASVLTKKFGPVGAGFAVARALRQISRLTWDGDLLSVPHESLDPATYLAGRYKKALPSRQRKFREAVKDAGFTLDRPVGLLLSQPTAATQFIEFLTVHFNVLDTLDSPDTGETLSVVKGFKANETTTLKSAAAKLLGDPTRGCRHVIMGHTHEPVREERYSNTGSWTRYFRWSNSSASSWSILHSGSYADFPYELLVARIETGPDPAVTLNLVAGRDR